jgi:hypothetical protein
VINLVMQRTQSDCGVCCLAMVTGRPYEDVLAAIGDAYDLEKGLGNEQEALRRLGYAGAYRHGQPMGDFVCLHRGYAISPDFFRDMAWGRRALLSVPSLNKPGGWHMVYYDGVRVLDPSQRRTYEQFTDLKPDELVLFREGKARAA